MIKKTLFKRYENLYLNPDDDNSNQVKEDFVKFWDQNLEDNQMLKDIDEKEEEYLLKDYFVDEIIRYMRQ